MGGGARLHGRPCRTARSGRGGLVKQKRALRSETTAPPGLLHPRSQERMSGALVYLSTRVT